MTASSWWRTYFDDAYFELHDPLFDEARSRREVAGMRELLGLREGARVLDAPCGWGRHARLLAQGGCVVFGADVSPGLLRRAQVTPAGDDAVPPGTPHTDATPAGEDDRPAPPPPAYVAADIRSLPYADSSFDAVINVFTSLGLFLSDDEDLRALREARRVLHPGGRLLLESMHRDDVIRAYAERDRWTLPDGTEVRVRRRFDAVTGISHERLRWRRGDEEGRKAHALRLRTATELDSLLRAAGFRDIDYFGGWEGSPFGWRDESLLAVARGTTL
jgi:ubiquinone/menaquinone biosynthesis C-methylase UbiE